MKKIFPVLFLLIAFLLPQHAQSASIRNMDDNAHTLLVRGGAEAYRVVLDPKGYIESLCSGCTIEVLGYSILDIEDEPLLQVVEGRLEVAP